MLCLAYLKGITSTMLSCQIAQTDFSFWMLVLISQQRNFYVLASSHAWYAEKIASQVGGDPNPVELKLSVMKPLGARWSIQLYMAITLSSRLTLERVCSCTQDYAYIFF